MKIQAFFDSAFGQPVCIESVVVNDKLVIARKTTFTGRKEGMHFITNNPLLDANFQFTNDDFTDALKAYQVLTSSNKCVIQSDLMPLKPDNVIDFAGQKDNGNDQYSIGILNNGHWAILATCLYFFRQQMGQRYFEKTMQFIDLMEENQNFFTTI